MILEIFFSFVVLFAVMAAALWALDGMRRPLGYEVPRILNVSIRARQSEDNKPDTAFWPLLDNALRRTRALPEVEGAALIMSPPYSNSTWESDSSKNGRKISYQENFGSDELVDVLGLKVTAGRWFSKEDDGHAGWDAVVINERLRREICPHLDRRHDAKDGKPACHDEPCRQRKAEGIAAAPSGDEDRAGAAQHEERHTKVPSKNTQ